MTKPLFRHLLFGITILVMIWLFQPVISYTLFYFNDPAENMGYGWLVPLGTVVLIWQRRHQLKAGIGLPDLRQASLLLLACAFLFIFGERGGQGRLSQMALALSTLALPWAFYGWRTAKWLILPAFLLFFIIPIDFLDSLTFHMRMLTVSISTGVLNGFGISVTHVGTAIYSQGATPFHLDVADPCSGIRSLFGIMAFTALYGAFVLNCQWKRWVLFLASFPLAMLGNVIRLFLTGIVASIGGQEMGLKLHDHALFIIGPVTFLLVFALSDWLMRRKSSTPTVATVDIETSPTTTPLNLQMGSLIRLLIIPFVMILLSIWLRFSDGVAYNRDDFIVKTMPDLADYTESYPGFCQNKACLFSDLFNSLDEINETQCPLCQGKMGPISYGELSILPSDTRLMKANYTASSGYVYYCSIVLAGQSRASIHRPEMCLPAQGFTLTPRQTLQVPLEDGTIQPISFMQINRSGLDLEGFMYFFFTPKYRCNTHSERIFTDVWERTVHNRIIRWSMVTIRSTNTFTSEEDLNDLKVFIAQLSQALLPSPDQPVEE